MKKILTLCMSALLFLSVAASASAADVFYTVVRGDSLWKIAVRHEIGVSEIIAANPQIQNPNLIYPGDIVRVPLQDAGVAAYEDEVIRLVNAERARYGLSPLSKNWELCRVARYKSQDMADRRYFSHTSPTYGSPFQMMKAFGITYRAAGENIAYGQRTPQEVVSAWMNSPGHRANILNAAFTEIGVGYVASGNYWTQMFIG